MFLFRKAHCVMFKASLRSIYFFKQPMSLFNFCDINRLNIDKFLENKPLEKVLNIEKNTTPFIQEHYVTEFSNELDWENSVLKSHVPVVVDCYADWCAPCKKLLPFLLSKVDQYRNFKLVKINIEKNHELAEKMGIESLPTVFLVYKGNVVDSFVGIPNEKRLNEFFESINLLNSIGEDDTIIRSLLKGADEWLHKRQWDQAENMFNEALSYEKWRKKYVCIINLGLAYCSYNKNNFDMAEKQLKELNENYANDIKADEELRKKLSILEIKIMTKKNPSLLTKTLENLESEIINNPIDLNLRYDLALQYFENSDYEKSINILIEIIKIDRNWNKKAANNFLIKIFNFLGSNNGLTIDGRKTLSKVLF